MKHPAFFSNDELELFAQYANKPYDKNNSTHHDVVQTLLNGLWKNTFYWGERVANALPKFQVEGKKAWQKLGRSGTQFKPYTWVKIFKKEDRGKGIYFTVGVDATEQSLVFKLDFQWEGDSNLSKDQKKECELLIKESEASWQSISIKEIQKGKINWDNLIEVTIEFINKYEALYEEVISRVWQNPEKISRVCWNEYGWVKPSGAKGKSQYKNSYEYENGFGYEEWLFDFDKQIDGYHYAFLEPIHRNRKLYAGQKFNISLYTINSISKQKYWIGRLKEAEVLSIKSSNQIFDYYKQNGWIDEMASQLVYEGIESNLLYSIAENLFNIRFKPQDAELLEEPLKISADDESILSGRYILLNKKVEPTFERRTDGKFIFIEKPPLDSQDYVSSYTRDSRLIELVHTHKQISQQLYLHLKQTHPTGKVSTEQDTGHGTKIDMVLNVSDNLTFFEIKTYNSTKANIREALGQLLEYSFYPNSSLAKELVIVSHLPATKEIILYIQHLRNQFQLPIYYQQFNLAENKLAVRV